MRAVIALALVLGCAADQPGRSLTVRVCDEEGRSLPGVAIEVDGMPVTKTGGVEGRARISLSASGAPRARIAVACPPGSREANPRHVARRVEGGSTQLQMTFVCRPAQRTLALVVRAPGGSGAVLRADGEPIGTVAADGTLHAVLRRAPDSELQLMLDTGGLAVTPKDPLREHRVLDRDELLVFDQALSPTVARRPGRSPRPLPKQAGEEESPHGTFGGRR